MKFSGEGFGFHCSFSYTIVTKLVGEKKHSIVWILWSESCSVVSDSLWSHGLYSPWNSPGQNTGVGSHFLLQGIFSTQVSCIAGGFFTSIPTCQVGDWVRFPNRETIELVIGLFIYLIFSWFTVGRLYLSKNLSTSSMLFILLARLF